MFDDPAINRLIEEAQRIGKHATKDAAVAAALGRYIMRRKQLDVL